MLLYLQWIHHPIGVDTVVVIMTLASLGTDASSVVFAMTPRMPGRKYRCINYESRIHWSRYCCICNECNIPGSGYRCICNESSIIWCRHHCICKKSGTLVETAVFTMNPTSCVYKRSSTHWYHCIYNESGALGCRNRYVYNESCITGRKACFIYNLQPLLHPLV